MNKDTFCKAIEHIQKQLEYYRCFGQQMQVLFPQCYAENMMYDTDTIIDGYIATLRAVMNDEENWIEYFLWELNFGEENWRLKVYDKDDNEIPLSTAEDLYNLLKQEQNERANKQPKALQ